MDKSSKYIKWTTEIFREKMLLINPDIEVLGEYINSSSGIKCQCKVCGLEWHPRPNNLLKGSKCPKCSKENKGKLRRLTQKDFENKVYDINENIEIIGEYVNTKTNIKCKCKVCGYEWFPKADSLLRGRGCLKCSYTLRGKSRRLQQEEFEKKLQQLNPFIKVNGKYENAYSEIDCECIICGYKWKAVPHNLLSGRGCPNCCRSGTSYIEQFILKSFICVCGEEKVLSRDKTIIGKEIDIYIPDLNFAVEPGAWDLHKNRVDNDILKEKLCKNKNIQLVTIYYGCKNDVVPQFQNVIVFKEDISKESQQQVLRELIYLLFQKVGIDKKFSCDEWNIIKDFAYKKSRKTNTKEFKSKLLKVNSDIKILGEYRSSQEKIECQCKICGNRWMARPDSLMNGKGCPNCWNNRRGQSNRFSQDDFMEKLSKVNPNIDVLGKYKGSQEKIECICKICGHRWNPKANSILSGKGCPRCTGNYKISSEDFLKRMKEVNDNVEIIGEYFNANTKIECRCKICNYIWMSRPHDLLNGHGCPECAKLSRREIRRTSQEQFEYKLHIQNPYIKVLGKYVNSKTKIDCECLVCKNHWSSIPNSLLVGHGCPICAKQKRIKTRLENKKH